MRGINDPNTLVTFSVKFYYTRAFERVTDDIPAFLDMVRDTVAR